MGLSHFTNRHRAKELWIMICSRCGVPYYGSGVCKDCELDILKKERLAKLKLRKLKLKKINDKKYERNLR